jgi:hypothetical protein
MAESSTPDMVRRMRPACRKVFSIGLWSLSGLVILLVLASGLLLWRLAAGPLPVNFLTPHLEAALAASLAGRRIDVWRTVLVWHVDSQRLELQARQVRILAEDDTPLATLPIVDVTLSVASLLRGTIALKTVNLEAARVRLVRAEDGSFRLGTTQEESIPPPSQEPHSSGETSGSENQSQIIADIVKTLVAETDSAQPMTSLEEVRLTRGSVMVHDQRLGTTWRATQVVLSLRRSSAGLTGKAQLNLALQDTLAKLEATLAYARSTTTLALDCAFSQLHPSTLAAVVPNLAPLAGVKVPLNGTLSTTLDLQGQVGTLHLKLSGQAGSLGWPEFFSVPLPIDSFTAHGRIDGKAQTATLDEATVIFSAGATPGPRLNLKGRIETVTDQVIAQAQITLNSFHLAEIERYWPQGISLPPRTWLLQNGPPAVIDELHGTVVFTSPRDAIPRGQVVSVDGTLNAHVPHPGAPARLTVQGGYNQTDAVATLDVGFSNLRPATITQRTPMLSSLAGVDVPLDGKVVLHLDTAGTVRDLRVELTGKAGTVTHPILFPEARHVASLAARGQLNAAEQTFTLQEATMSLGTPTAPGPRIKANGALQGVKTPSVIKAQVTLQALPLVQLRTYWPMGISADARAWLTENLAAGAIDEAKANLVLQLPNGSKSTAHLQQLTGTIRYSDLDVHYLRPLPPATGVSGTASFTPQGFRIQINRGQVSSMQFTTGTVDITGLDQRQDAMNIRVGVHTPLRTALTLLNHPRLNLLSEMGINPNTTDGQARVELGIALPLRGEIDLPLVDITARGTLEKVSMQQVVLGHSVENGQMTLTLDKAGMTLKGTAEVATIPATFEWQEAFTTQTPWNSQLRAVVPRLEGPQLAKLGVDLSEYVSGPLAAAVSAKLGKQGAGQIHTQLRLDQAALTLPFLGWHKAAGEAGEAQGVVHLSAGASPLGTLTLTAGTLSASGNFRLGNKPTLRVQLQDLVIGTTRLKEVAIEHHEHTLDIVLGAGDVDVYPLIRPRAAQGPVPAEGDTSRRTPKPTSSPPKDGLQIHLRAPALRRVYFASNRYLEEVNATLMRTPVGWEMLQATAQVPESQVQLSRPEQRDSQEGQPPPVRTVRLVYRPTPPQTYTLSVQTNDLGSTLRAMNFHDGIIGGQLLIDGQTLDTEPGKPLLGRLEIKEFTLKEAPILARVLAAASLPGVLKLLNHDGLAFSRLSGEFTYSDRLLTFKHLRTHGGALGLTAKGPVDTKNRTLNLKGTIVPFYGLNTLLSHIPILGNILVGGKGEGLIAMSYRVTGKFAEPQVSVNPASVLTPGFLRGIFDLFESNSEVDIENQLPPSASQEATP